MKSFGTKIVLVALLCIISEPLCVMQQAQVQTPSEMGPIQFLQKLSIEEKKLLLDVIIIPLLSAGICLGMWHWYFKEKKIKAIQPCQQENRKTFADVIGASEAKEFLQSIVEYLNNPQQDKFTRFGIQCPKGVILYGPPGTGKTLLAKAVAGEARCAFFSKNGSEFIEQYIGMGALRVRELFEQARAHAPSIIYIDEIDALACKRSNNSSQSEHNHTVAQLLAEMDGFEESSQPIFVIGGTNRVKSLDPGLRSGRFDNKIYVPLPCAEERIQLLKHLMQNKPTKNIDSNLLATATEGFSGADLANLVNQAALYAVRHNENVQFLEQPHFEYALKNMMNERYMAGS